MGKRVIPRRDEVEVYLSEKGLICISQPDPVQGRQETIALPHEDVPKLIEFLTDILEERRSMSEDAFDSGEGQDA
jgi:hypothetical protein